MMFSISARFIPVNSLSRSRRSSPYDRLSSEIDAHPLVGHPLQAIDHQAIEAEMRDESLPYRRCVRHGVSRHQPSVRRRHDVGILMGEEDVLELRALQHRGRVGEHPRVDLVSARIEDHVATAAPPSLQA